MANILDHNGPFSVNEDELQRRRLQYYFPLGEKDDTTDESTGEGSEIAGGAEIAGIGTELDLGLDLDGDFAHSEGGGAVQVSMGPPGAARAGGMIHLAIIEAYSCVTRKFGFYYDKTNNIDCHHASSKAAVAQAAHDVMVGFDDARGLYYHNATIIEYLNMALDKSLAKQKGGKEKLKGIEVGKKIARLVLEDRKTDGWAYEVSTRTRDIICRIFREQYLIRAVSFFAGPISS